MVGEVTALEHELGDDTVESRSSIAESLLSSAESSEVLSSLGDGVGIELQLNSAQRRCPKMLEIVTSCR